MADLIKLLPDTIANQIAAGEVIQRPASVIKELVENSVDSGATEILVDIKDSGKTLILVEDNGKGMNEVDARMSLERHATSKISNADDLFAITTKGFRGEALASISAIAQMDIYTKQSEVPLGTHIEINGGKIEVQEPASCPSGTQISVKNLFYNVPARRKFLKSDNVEMRHIIDQFERVAIAHPSIKFTLKHNGADIFLLPSGKMRQRLIGIFGRKYNEKLVPVQQETPLVNIHGFVLKPEASKKTRGEQFFFVNDRYIKSPFLHQMVIQAYDELIPKGFHPGYFVFLEVDPSFIDINIHPTKTEIKFEDERSVGMLMRSAIKQSIGMFNVSPTIDFNPENSFSPPPIPKGKMISEPKISVNENFNPFHSGNDFEKNPSGNEIRGLQEMYDGLDQASTEIATSRLDQLEVKIEAENNFDSPKLIQVNSKYILSTLKNGLILINQTRAHQRVLFDEFIEYLESGMGSNQQLLFPENITLSASQSELLKSLIPELTKMGFDLEVFGVNSFIVRGLPNASASEDPKTLIEGVLVGFESNVQNPNIDQNQALASALAFKASVKTGKKLKLEEMQDLTNKLFASSNPETLPNGKRITKRFELDELENFFN